MHPDILEWWKKTLQRKNRTGVPCCKFAKSTVPRGIVKLATDLVTNFETAKKGQCQGQCPMSGAMSGVSKKKMSGATFCSAIYS